MSDKLKELRGLNKSNGVKTPNAENPTTSESKPAQTNVTSDEQTESNEIDPTSTEASTTTKNIKPINAFDRSTLLKNKLKKGRKLFGSKVNNLFAKKSLKKFSLFAPTKPPKIIPSAKTLPLTTSPLQSNTKKELKDEKSSNDKVDFFFLNP